jgi:hypothetical protein
MPLPNMTPQQLLSAARFLAEHEHMCDVVLVKNQVGNLAIVDADDYQVGWVDLRTGEVTCYECDDTDGEPAT